jgi:hypothetical protein
MIGPNANRKITIAQGQEILQVIGSVSKMAEAQQIRRFCILNSGVDIENYLVGIEYEKISSWLGAADPLPKFERLLYKRLRNTGNWILQNEDYIRFKSTPGSSLWLHGIRTPSSLPIVYHLLKY